MNLVSEGAGVLAEDEVHRRPRMYANCQRMASGMLRYRDQCVVSPVHDSWRSSPETFR